MSDDVGYGKVRAATWPQGRPAPATRRGGTDPAEVWNGPRYQVVASHLRGMFLVVVESNGRQETRKIILH